MLRSRRKPPVNPSVVGGFKAELGETIRAELTRMMNQKLSARLRGSEVQGTPAATPAESGLIVKKAWPGIRPSR